MYAHRKFVVLLDCNGIMHMLKHGIKKDMAHGGYETSIIYGFLGAIRSYAARFNTHQFVFAWDARKSLRLERYPWYKGKDKKEEEQLTPAEQQFEDSIFRQFNQLRRYVIPTIGFKNAFYAPGYEADDLIANVVRQNPEHRIILVSRDADMYQLLDHCFICNPATKETYTRDDYMREYRLTPDQWVDVKSIGGCLSDKVPGVTGVGEATAVQWIRGELKPKGKRYKAITADLASENSVAARNEWLVRLPLPGTPDTPISFEDERLSLFGFEDVCSRFGFRSFLEKTTLAVWKQQLNLQEEEYGA